MFLNSRKKCVSLFLFCLFSIGSQTVFAQDKAWREISPAELQMKTPKVEPDADAEVIFWEVRVDDSSAEELVMKHYVRVKVFTERGREKYSKVDIPFINNSVKDFYAKIMAAEQAPVVL